MKIVIYLQKPLQLLRYSLTTLTGYMINLKFGGTKKSSSVATLISTFNREEYAATLIIEATLLSRVISGSTRIGNIIKMIFSCDKADIER